MRRRPIFAPAGSAAAVSFGKRIPDSPLYALALIPLALRMVAMAPRHTPRAVEAG
jgi:methionine sulfoxide reductase heme-binding subunit